MQTLEDHEGEGAQKVDEDIRIEDKELEYNRELAQVMENTTQQFVTSSEIHPIISAQMKRSTHHRSAAVLAGLEEYNLFYALHFRYDAPMEGVETLLFNYVGECIVGIIQQMKMCSPLM